uniref:Uncharacterized protein n=1 Tax=Schistocephalus solidus TaxID=70667 RepID=A0A0X3PX45_SCHSO
MPIVYSTALWCRNDDLRWIIVRPAFCCIYLTLFHPHLGTHLYSAYSAWGPSVPDGKSRQQQKHLSHCRAILSSKDDKHTPKPQLTVDSYLDCRFGSIGHRDRTLPRTSKLFGRVVYLRSTSLTE